MFRGIMFLCNSTKFNWDFLILFLFRNRSLKNDYPALVVELKWNKNANTALDQIKEKRYPESIMHYTGNILLVGINYDKNSKEHQCMIEPYEKD